MTSNPLKAILASAALAGLVSLTAHAQIVTYNVVSADNAPVDSVSPDQTLANSVAAPASDLDLGPGLYSAVYPFGYSFGSNGSSGSLKFSDSLSGAVADEAYINFTVTPETGFALDLTSLDLSGASFETDDSGTYYVAVESSVGDFSGALATPTAFTTSSASGPLINLGSAYSDLTTQTEFRLYFYQASDAPNDYPDLTLKDGSAIVLNGTVDVATLTTPEPGTYALLGLGLVTLVLVGRHRRLTRI